jgi:hypothetical protein
LSNLHDRSRARQAHIVTPPLPPVTYHGGKVLWSPELLEWLRNAWASGLPGQAIADRMGHGITKNSVIGKKGRSPGFIDRPSPIVRLTTPEQETRIKELILLNRSPKDISRMTGTTTDQIYRVRIREMLPPAGRVVVRRTERVVPRLFDQPPMMPTKPVCAAPPRAEVVAFAGGSTRRCQFPLWGDSERPKFTADGSPLVCGDGTVAGGSWCPAHWAVCFSGRRAA